MGDIRKIKKGVCVLSLVMLVGMAFFVLRGPHISNALKKIILPELEMATGRKVIAQKIYINLFPLFIEAKGMKVFDEKGERIFLIQRVKAYVGLSGLVKRQVVIRRIVIKEPEVTADRRQSEEIANNIKAYLARPRDTVFKVKIKALEIQNGSAVFGDPEKKTTGEIKGLNAEILLGGTPRITASAQKIVIKKEGWPEIGGDAAVSLSVKDEMITIKKILIGSLGSKITGAAEYQKDRGNFRTSIELLLSTVKNIFSLERSGYGKITAQGAIQYINKKFVVDLKVSGNFYIQTLMELLKVRERIEGLIDLKGEIKGSMDDIKGIGTATLRKGNLFDVDIDTLRCKISYANGVMNFSEGVGRLFNGSAKVTASIRLPVVNFFTLSVDFSDIDSLPVFRLIGWNPGIEPGKVSGSLASSGAEFNPEGLFEYKRIKEGKDALGRIRDIKGRFKMEGQLLSLTGLRLLTGRSEIEAAGKTNIKDRTLDFASEMKTSDVTDITSPYFDKLKGRAEFTGKISGSFDDPVISGKIKMMSPVFENYSADTLDSDLLYRKNLLDILSMDIEGKSQKATLGGKIYFRNARELFDFARPEYRLRASLKKADLEKVVKIFYPGFVGRGTISGNMGIEGKDSRPDLKGTAVIENASVHSVPFDSASFDWNYSEKRVNFTRMRIVKGKSVLVGDAGLDTSGNFSYKAYADRVLLSDLVQRSINGDAVFSIRTEGHGTSGNPSIVFNARMIEGTLKGKPIGSGIISASVKDRDISLTGRMLNDNIHISAEGRLEKEIPWNARVEVQTGRYDSLISAFLKDVPEDLVLSLNGTVALNGDKRHINARSVIRKIALSMYGYSFTNDKEMRVDLHDRHLAFEKISLRSGNTSLQIDGSLEIGNRYNLVLEGSSDVSPFKSLSSKIGLFKGDAEFVISVAGDWEKPQINGGVNLANGSFGLKEYPYRLTSLNGYLFIDNDRIVLQRLSGKLGGGDVGLSGIVYLQRFSFKRFYIEASLNNITASVANGFAVNLDGNVVYRGTPTAQLISGDLKLNRARYRERIEWKSWLLEAKKVERYKAEISDFEKAELNVRISADNSIRIDNNLARASMSAEMILRGTIYRPILLGRLESEEGTVYIRNNEFRILHANAHFADTKRINPFVDISAETNVKGYKIRMNLDGQIDHFNVSLSSDPVLKESDIFSLLAVGRLGSEMKGLEGGIGAGEATSFLTGKIQDVVEERIRSITGLDRFQIDPHVSKKTGSVEPRVTVSKRVLGDKLFVTYASSVGSTEEQIIKLEYVLSRHVSLVGGRDESGFSGADIQFRFHFK